MSRHKSPLSNTYVFNFQGIFGEVGKGIQSLDDLNFYGTQYFLKKLQELKGSYNITVVDKFSPGTGVGHSMVPGRVMVYMSMIRPNGLKVVLEICPQKMESNFTHPT